MKYTTDYNYTSREDKMFYVYKKYKSILDGKKIIDICADRGYLRQHLPDTSSYTNIGFGPDILKEWNLENIPYPFKDKQFDTVLCLDVLEHLENIHAAFDECLRLAKEYVIISLPNAYQDFWNFLKNGKYMGRSSDMKFYGLPQERPEDRHRWFLGPEEAYKFIEYRAQLLGFSIEQFDCLTDRSSFFEKIIFKYLFSAQFKETLLTSGTLWFVLARNR